MKRTTETATENKGKAKPSLVSFEPLGWLRASATETTDPNWSCSVESLEREQGTHRESAVFPRRSNNHSPTIPTSDFVEICIEPIDLFACQGHTQVLADQTLHTVIIRLA